MKRIFPHTTFWIKFSVFDNIGYVEGIWLVRHSDQHIAEATKRNKLWDCAVHIHILSINSCSRTSAFLNFMIYRRFWTQQRLYSSCCQFTTCWNNCDQSAKLTFKPILSMIARLVYRQKLIKYQKVNKLASAKLIDMIVRCFYEQTSVGWLILVVQNHSGQPEVWCFGIPEPDTPCPIYRPETWNFTPMT